MPEHPKRRGSASEYRVRWKREGRGQTTRIYQSWDAAHRKAEGILALEAVKAESGYRTMPDLEVAPVIEVRPVGAWEPNEHQVTEPSEYAQRRMAEWVEYTQPREMDDAPVF